MFFSSSPSSFSYNTGRYALFPEKIDICSFLETRFGLECQDPFKIKGFFSVVLKPLISSCLR